MEIGGRTARRARVDGGHCVACGCCVRMCPMGALSIPWGVRAQVDGARCVGCGRCVPACPGGLIQVEVVEG